MKIKPKALVLISGGLDSLLATKLIIEQGIYVEAINFFTGFTGDYPEHIKKSLTKEYRISNTSSAKKVAEQLGVKLHIVNVVQEFKNILIKPKYGYGANLNPCLDCKLFMVNKAYKWMQKLNFDFIATGEVVGQRPKSQLKHKLPIVAKNTNERLLRPLCAKLLPETFPERAGLVKRELLCAFCGRSRKPQLELIKKFGITEFAQPAGGCALTNPNYTKRLRDLLQSRNNEDYSLDDIMLLKLGRHLRIAPHFKIIIGRNSMENQQLEIYKKKFINLQNQTPFGALLLIDGKVNQKEINFASRLAAYFSKSRNSKQSQVLVNLPFSNQAKTLTVKPLTLADFDNKWYIN